MDRSLYINDRDEWERGRDKKDGKAGAGIDGDNAHYP